MTTKGIRKGDLEALLSEALVPVEPRSRFVRRLRARLVHYRGEGPLTGWTVVMLVATGLMVVIASLGIVLRLALGLMALIGLASRRREQRVKRAAST